MTGSLPRHNPVNFGLEKRKKLEEERRVYGIWSEGRKKSQCKVSRTFATVSVCLDVCLVLMFYTDVMIVFKAQYGSIRYGLTENAGRENGGQSKLQGMKLQDMNMTDQKWRQGVKLREYRSSDRLQRRNAKSIQSIRPQMFVASEPVSYRTLLCPVVSCFMSCYFMSCIFMSCHLVRHFHVQHFQRPLRCHHNSTARISASHHAHQLVLFQSISSQHLFLVIPDYIQLCH